MSCFLSVITVSRSRDYSKCNVSLSSRKLSCSSGSAMAPTMRNTQILLKSYPKGFPTLDNFDTVTSDISKDVTGSDDVLVQLLDLSVDPYLRGRMSPAASYASSFELGKVCSTLSCLQQEFSLHASLQACHDVNYVCHSLCTCALAIQPNVMTVWYTAWQPLTCRLLYKVGHLLSLSVFTQQHSAGLPAAANIQWRCCKSGQLQQQRLQRGGHCIGSSALGQLYTCPQGPGSHKN